MRCSSSASVFGSVDDDHERLPRTEASKISTMPSMRAISAASFGRRASKSSATRGRPPVMSLVLDALRGVLASVSRRPRSCRHSLTFDLRAGREWNKPAISASCHRSTTSICGLQIFLVLDDDRGNDARWCSSSSRFMVTPSIMSLKCSEPAFSERIGDVVRIPLRDLVVALLDLGARRRLGDDGADTIVWFSSSRDVPRRDLR